ncbi:MAG: NADH-quinone oxidoreductase subunit B, partial [Aquifex sp.]
EQGITKYDKLFADFNREIEKEGIFVPRELKV